MRVSKTEFPAIYRAFETISHDRGTQAGHAWYEIPENLYGGLQLDQINFALLCLVTDEFDTFCIGEEGDKWRIAGDHAWLLDADKLLNEFFESDWQGPMLGMMNDTCDFCWKEMADGQLRVMPFARGNPLACPKCFGKYRSRIREEFKQNLAYMIRTLPVLQLRARVSECLDYPTVYVPPPTKKERAVSRFELWKDYNEAQGYAGFARGGGRR